MINYQDFAIIIEFLVLKQMKNISNKFGTQRNIICTYFGVKNNDIQNKTCLKKKIILSTNDDILR